MQRCGQAARRPGGQAVAGMGALSRTACRVASTGADRVAMPEVVVVGVPREVNLSETPPPPPPTVLARVLRVLYLPLRVVRALLSRLWRRLFGPLPRP